MTAPAKPAPPEPPSDDARPEPGYDAWLAEEIAAGCAELDAGDWITLDELRQSLGLT